MVLRRLPDSECLEATYKVKLKRPLMESGADRRVRVASSKDSCTATAAATTTTTTATATAVSSSLEGFRGNVVADLRNLQSTTALPATRQKVRRPLEEELGWQECVLSGQKRRVVRCTVGGDRLVKNCTSTSSSSSSSNAGIISTRGEHARNNCAKKRSPAILNEGLRLKEDGLRSSSLLAGKPTRSLLYVDDPVDEVVVLARRKTSFSRRPLAKSISVPENLKEVTRGKSPLREEGGILKRSSAFLASLTQTAARVSERKSRVGDSRKLGKIVHAEGYVPDYAKGYFSVLTNGEDNGLLRSPSLQTLPTSWKKKRSGTGVKKSVSFSSDTSFEEKRTAARKNTVHEVKVYRKGVLQGRDTREKIVTKVPPSWETPSGGPAALLRAASQADDVLLKEIVTRVRKMGLGNMDINMLDSSGRSAISYMAGNGAAAMLEAALAFDGVDPNLPDNEGNTPLHFAAQAGQTECLNILLQRCPEIEVDARNSLGFTPLMKAAIQGRTKCAKILLFAGANPTLRDHGRGLRAEQWARFCGRYVCAEVIERFARHRLLERTTSCRWGSEPELAAKVLQGKVMPVPTTPAAPASTGLKSRIRRVFRTTSGPDRSFSLVSQLTSAALCVSSPALPKPGDVPPLVKSLLRPLSVPQLRVTLVAPHEIVEKTAEKYGTSFSEKIENSMTKPPRTKKKSK